MRLLTHLPLVLAAVVAASAIAFVAVSVLAGGRLPGGPVDPAWDRAACAHCRMHLGEPSFATQLQTEDGRVLFFDDPGCAALLLDQAGVGVHALYFHHLREDRWVAAARAGFVPVALSPMGFGFGVVDAGAGGAISWAEAAACMTKRSPQ